MCSPQRRSALSPIESGIASSGCQSLGTARKEPIKIRTPLGLIARSLIPRTQWVSNEKLHPMVSYSRWDHCVLPEVRHGRSWRTTSCRARCPCPGGPTLSENCNRRRLSAADYLRLGLDEIRPGVQVSDNCRRQFVSTRRMCGISMPSPALTIVAATRLWYRVGHSTRPMRLAGVKACSKTCCELWRGRFTTSKSGRKARSPTRRRSTFARCRRAAWISGPARSQTGSNIKRSDLRAGTSSSIHCCPPIRSRADAHQMAARGRDVLRVTEVRGGARSS